MFKPIERYTTQGGAGVPVCCSWDEENHRNTTVIQLGEVNGQKFWRARTTPKSPVVKTVKTEWQIFDEDLPIFHSRWFPTMKKAVENSVQLT